MIYIATMHEVNLRSLDLNLLVALKALLDEKHVSRAAARIGLSQPAMSRALQRLRKSFNDPLLVKSINGLCLTTRAIDLYQSLQNIFAEINHIMSPPISNPAEMRGEIAIATRDYETVTVLPSLINFVSDNAPHLKLRVVSLLGDDLTPLERREVDFIIAASESKSATLCRYTLFNDGFVCLVSDQQPILQQNFTLEKFLIMKHCLVTISGNGAGLVDELLEQKGLKRNIAVRVPHFMAAIHIVATSKLIVTLPARIGYLLAQNYPIKLLQPPIPVPKFAIYVYWHIKNQTNQMHQWIRNHLRQKTCD